MKAAEAVVKDFSNYR